MSGKKLVIFVSLLVQFYAPKAFDQCSCLQKHSWKSFILVHVYYSYYTCSYLITHSAWTCRLHFIPTRVYGKQLLLEESKVEMHEVRLGSNLTVLEVQICKPLGRWAFNFITSLNYHCCLFSVLFQPDSRLKVWWLNRPTF